MERILDSLDKLGADFASVRREDSRKLTLFVTDKIERISENDHDVGYMIKPLVNGSYNYKTISWEPTFADLQEAIRANPKHGNETVPEIKPEKAVINLTPKGSGLEKSIEEKLQDIKGLKQALLNYDKRIKHISLAYAEVHTNKVYADSLGSLVVQSFPLSLFEIEVVAKSGKEIATATSNKSTNQGYVFDFFDRDKFLQGVQEAVTSQLKGAFPKSGEYEVVLAPAALGTFVHEAFGHLAEADLAKTGILYQHIGGKIADSSVSISDYPTLPHTFSGCFAEYDDEGIKGRKAEILKNGKVNELMTNIHFANELGTKPTGNALAESSRDRTLVRMRNTYMEIGDATADELISNVKNGYLIISAPCGSTTSEGTFQFGIVEAYRIEKGTVMEGVKRGVSISGSTLDTLSKITGVSKEFDVDSGVCTKCNQSVHISTGGPYAKIDKIKVGGNA
ncbi:Zinc metalloprotease TldD [uncultured archaeon]|nr:Zinc metalloprotease TldD [uncultured archaeon]